MQTLRGKERGGRRSRKSPPCDPGPPTQAGPVRDPGSTCVPSTTLPHLASRPPVCVAQGTGADMYAARKALKGRVLLVGTRQAANGRVERAREPCGPPAPSHQQADTKGVGAVTTSHAPSGLQVSVLRPFRRRSPRQFPRGQYPSQMGPQGSVVTSARRRAWQRPCPVLASRGRTEPLGRP